MALINNERVCVCGGGGDRDRQREKELYGVKEVDNDDHEGKWWKDW
jgi:hypothetical protein